MSKSVIKERRQTEEDSEEEDDEDGEENKQEDDEFKERESDNADEGPTHYAKIDMTEINNLKE